MIDDEAESDDDDGVDDHDAKFKKIYEDKNLMVLKSMDTDEKLRISKLQCESTSIKPNWPACFASVFRTAHRRVREARRASSECHACALPAALL